MRAKVIEVLIYKGSAIQQLDSQVDAFNEAITVPTVTVRTQVGIVVAKYFNQHTPVRR